MIKFFEKDVWESFTDSDLTEGRGSKVHIAYFKTRADAERASKNRGVMGADAYVECVAIEVKIYENYDEYKQACNESIREMALAKLTLEEKRALGLL